MSIRTKLAASLAAILIVNLATDLYGFYLYRQSCVQATAVREEGSLIVATALSTHVHFKKQVQEWKNLLLRGRDQTLYNRHLRQFEQEEANVRETIGRLIALLAENAQAREAAQAFLEAHVRLGSEYREALRFFQAEDPGTQVRVDLQVRRADREPSDLLDRVVENAQAHKDQELARIAAATAQSEQRIVFLIAGVMSGAVLLLIWLTDRIIAQPVATATAVARRISAGDLSSPIPASGSGETAQMLAALKAMQESLRASRESLRQSEAETRLLLESTGEGVYGVDTEGRCVFCNPAGLRLLGYESAQQLLGKEMHSTMHHSYPDGSPYPREDCGASETYRNGKVVHVEGDRFWRANGTGFPVEYRSHPVYRGGRLMGAVVNFSDISGRRRAEAELRAARDALATERTLLAERVRGRTAELRLANAELARIAQAKDAFLAAMSHELRTPLTAILGLAETLQDGLLGTLNERQIKAAHTIGESGTHLLALINDILDVAKIASGTAKLVLDKVPADQLWDASLRLVRQAAKHKDIEISTNIDPGVRLVHGDSRRLKQILVNLLDNAVKFTPEHGSIGLDVAGDKDKGVVKIGVWDTGIGIPAQEREHLFEPFVQLDSELSHEHEGSGLGLALVRGMVELHRGRVEVHSEVGRGSRFEVTLPWDAASQEVARAQQTEDAQGEANVEEAVVGRPRVLLVEDNPSNRELLAEFLQIKGYEVQTVGSGAEALAAARERRPALILMDVQMPGLDGLETSRRLRSEFALRSIPIVALSALAMPGDRERCLDAGMDDYLSKPVGLKELHRTLSSWLKRKRDA